jgi:hypothetical protein
MLGNEGRTGRRRLPARMAVGGAAIAVLAAAPWAAANVGADPAPASTITCQATGVAVSAANPAAPPTCVTDLKHVPGLDERLGLIGLRVQALAGATQWHPSGRGRGDRVSGEAGADLADLRLTVGGLMITADAVRSYALVACRPGDGVAHLEGHSVLVDLRLGGKPPGVGGASVTIPLPGIGVLYLNHQTVSNGVLTQRALWLTGPLLGEGVVIGESRVGATSAACATPAA